MPCCSSLLAPRLVDVVEKSTHLLLLFPWANEAWAIVVDILASDLYLRKERMSWSVEGRLFLPKGRVACTSSNKTTRNRMRSTLGVVERFTRGWPLPSSLVLLLVFVLHCEDAFACIQQPIRMESVRSYKAAIQKKLPLRVCANRSTTSEAQRCI